MGNLYIVATPIGNVEDISLRAIKILSQVDIVLAEDTRETISLLTKLKINKKIISFHDHNEISKIKSVKKMLDEGKSLALVSDRGTPLISDPGFKLIKSLRQEKYNIIPIPGAVAFVNALIASGLPTNNFVFLGFIKHQNKYLEKYKDLPSTLVFYESVHRLEKFIIFLKKELGDREVVVAREITKLYETFYFGNLSNILSKIDSLKGEFVIMISPSHTIDFDEQFVLNEIKNLLKEKTKKEIMGKIMLKYNISKNKAYNLILEADK